MPSQNPQNSPIGTEDTTQRRCSTVCAADAFKMNEILATFPGKYPCQHIGEALHVEVREETSDLFIFPYGVAVFWGASPEEEARILEDLRPFENQKVKENLSDEFTFVYGNSLRIHRDCITLSSKDIFTKFAISNGIAQSMKLSFFETSVINTINKTRKIPEDLATKGKISLKRVEIIQKMGQLFMERSSVNLHLDLLGTPTFFWENDAYEAPYKLMRNYLDIPARLEILNHKLNTVHELYEILGNELNHQHSSALEWAIIWLIVIEVFISLGKDVFQFI